MYMVLATIKIPQPVFNIFSNLMWELLRVPKNEDTEHTYGDVIVASINWNSIWCDGRDGFHQEKVENGIVIRISGSHLVDTESDGNICNKQKSAPWVVVMIVDKAHSSISSSTKLHLT